MNDVDLTAELVSARSDCAAAQIEIEYLRDLLRNIYLFLCWPGDSFPKQTAAFHREVLEAEPWWEEKEETNALWKQTAATPGCRP